MYVEKSKYRINVSWFNLLLLIPIAAVIAFGLNVAHWSNQKQPMKNILLAMEIVQKNIDVQRLTES